MCVYGWVGLGEFAGCWIQKADCPGVEAVPHSGSVSTPVASSRGQEREEVVAGMCLISEDGHCSVLTADSVDFLKTRKLGPMIFWCTMWRCSR